MGAMADVDIRRRGVIPRPLSWIRAQLAMPLHRNAYALVASGSVTALLGLVYWSLAARRYSVHDLGIQSAAISAMLLLAGVAQLGLMPVLIRFLPVAGRQAVRVVRRCYAASIVVALLGAAVFLLGTTLWSPPLAFMRSSGMWWSAFLVGTAATCLSALQDGVLTGMRKAVWVPLENTLVSVSKIALLLILAASLPQSGIFVSWNIATVLAVISVNGLIFAQVFRRRNDFLVEPTTDEIRLRRLIRPALHNHVGNLFSLGALYAMPLIVVFRLGAASTAYFAIPWAIYGGLQQITTAMSFSLIVEAAAHPATLRPYFRRTLTHALALLTPAAMVAVSFAPHLLELLGRRYAAHGTDLLRWLAVASLPGAVLPMTLALARIRNRTRIVMTTQGGAAVLLLASSTVLLPIMGIAAVGVGALATNAVVAVLAGWRYLWPALGRKDPALAQKAAT